MSPSYSIITSILAFAVISAFAVPLPSGADGITHVQRHDSNDLEVAVREYHGSLDGISARDLGLSSHSQPTKRASDGGDVVLSRRDLEGSLFGRAGDSPPPMPSDNSPAAQAKYREDRKKWAAGQEEKARKTYNKAKKALKKMTTSDPKYAFTKNEMETAQEQIQAYAAEA
ncbi:hypothetical protein BT96DRAFT_925057, partial [Gymnopus androsaceus JB14]